MAASLGAAVHQFVTSFNIFGFGSDPIVIALAAVIALGITQKQVRQKDYSDTIAIFLATYATFFTIGWATSLPTMVAFAVIGAVGIILVESNKLFR